MTKKSSRAQVYITAFNRFLLLLFFTEIAPGRHSNVCLRKLSPSVSSLMKTTAFYSSQSVHHYLVFIYNLLILLIRIVSNELCYRQVFLKGGFIMRRGYNPYLLPPWIRKTRFYCKSIILPITVFELIRCIFIPTTFDFLLLCLLIGILVLFQKDII